MERPPNISLDELLAHAGWVRELAVALVGDRGSADDLVQDTWLAAMRRQPTDTSSVRPWLARVMRNLARDRWRGDERRRRREADSARPEATPGSVELAAELEMQRALGTALTEIEESLQGVLMRRYFHGLSTSEIARIERISERTVRDRLERGIQALRSKLDRKFGDRNAWAALLLPLARRAAVSASLPAAAATVPAGWFSLSLMWKASIALVPLIAVLGWMMKRETAHREFSPTLAAQSAFATDAPRTAATDSSIPTESARTPAAARTSVGDTRLIVRMLKWRTTEPVPGVHLKIMEMRHAAARADGATPASQSVLCAEGDTDSKGRAEFAVPIGIPLRVEHDDTGDQNSVRGDSPPITSGHSDVEALTAGEHRALDLEMFYGRDFPFWARLISDEDEQPIANGKARASGNFSADLGDYPEWSSIPKTEIVEADADGFFEMHLTYVQRLTLKLAVAAPEFGPGLVTLERGHDRREAALELRLSRSASLEARVIDEGVSRRSRLGVRLTAPTYALKATGGTQLRVYDGHISWYAACDPDGRASFPTLPSRAHFGVEIVDAGQVLLSIPEGAIDSLVLKPGELKRVEWKIGDGALVHGRALDTHLQPVQHHEIWLVRDPLDGVMHPGPTCTLLAQDDQNTVARTKTDEQGGFSFAKVASGTWWVGIAPPEDDGKPTPPNTIAPLAVSFEIGPAAREIDVTIRQQGTLHIRGKVMKPDGAPMSNASVEMGRIGEWLMQRTRTNAAGEFDVGPLDAGRWRLKATAVFEHAPSNEVEVEAGASDVVLHLNPGGSLSGVMHDNASANGEPVEIHLWAHDDPAASFSTEGSSEGEFRFKALQPGTYDIVVQTSGDRIGIARDVVVKASAETSRILIELEQGAVLELHYHGAHDYGGCSLSVDGLSLGDQGVENGSWTKVAVPPGMANIRQRTEKGEYVERHIAVHAGTETKVELEDL